MAITMIDGIRKGNAMRFRFMFGLLVLCVFLIGTMTHAAVKPYHLDRKYMPIGCASCHLGFDFSDGGGSYRCIACHGPAKAAPSSLTLQSMQTKDVTKDFAKNYRHPSFDKRNLHSAREVLPETNPAAPRHAECA